MDGMNWWMVRQDKYSLVRNWRASQGMGQEVRGVRCAASVVLLPNDGATINRFNSLELGLIILR